MTHQLNIFLLLFGALQGVLLSFWFLRNSRNKQANLWFGVFLLLIGFQLTIKVITKGWLMDHALFPYKLHYTFPYLIGPVIFLYIRARLRPQFSYVDLLHFLPFLIFSALSFVTLRSIGLPFGYVHPYLQSALQVISLLIYGAWAARLSHSPLKGFIWIVLCSETIIAITLGIMIMYNRQLPDLRLMFIALTILVYWIGYKVVSTPDFFLNAELPAAIQLKIGKGRKYAHSSLKPGEVNRIEKMLEVMMKKEKLFLDPDLTLDKLAAKLGTTRHNLSQYLNENLYKSYFDYINDLRLEEAKARLGDKTNYRFTIAAIALDSGFNSVSNFNEVFKKKFGITPSKFRDQSLKQMSA